MRDGPLPCSGSAGRVASEELLVAIAKVNEAGGHRPQPGRTRSPGNSGRSGSPTLRPAGTPSLEWRWTDLPATAEVRMAARAAVTVDSWTEVDSPLTSLPHLPLPRPLLLRPRCPTPRSFQLSRCQRRRIFRRLLRHPIRLPPCSRDPSSQRLHSSRPSLPATCPRPPQ